MSEFISHISPLAGIFILGVLAGWIVEWIFVRLFVPNPGKKAETELKASRKQVEDLQKKNAELQASLTAAQASAAKAEKLAAETKAAPAPAAIVEAKAAPAAAAETKPAAKPVPAKVEAALVGTGNDDLTKLGGVGPKLAEAMNAAGISSYAQIAELGVEQLNERLAASGIRYSKAAVESWAPQAKLAAMGDWEALKNYQASLKA
ncbi:helix-hairpin-helix domain-containing protein [Thiothrix nivea]|uniref:LSU ribosomal protein L21p n=1 Tax=Thiothrix nivea (strain ATCC 35100 / DSM 5205 / JP2) TaxID=870187 RepID=A0A656HC12_THINJ|nr:helix-hairpin-helix domain-containing protein [Thiothrix nivea]EIJ32990.1 hypothetical protein Thini_0334 [Thiothrix nivea DSM 5205]